MWRLRDETRVGLCPSRIVIAKVRRWSKSGVVEQIVQPVASDPVEELRRLDCQSRLSVVLSNHFVRYALLPWSGTLTGDADWLAYARHSFAATHGDSANDWEILVSPAGHRKARVACAIDGALLRGLRDIPLVASVQPYLMAAFNRARRTLRESSFWFVVGEPGRLTIALMVDRAWKLVRNRQAAANWPAMLEEILDRESAALDECECDCVAVHSDAEVSRGVGRYRIVDLTAGFGASTQPRAGAMALV